MEVPDDVELHTYGSQSNNIYEWQKDQLRAKIENDKSHFYTYAKDYLSLAFPIVDENMPYVSMYLTMIAGYDEERI